ncbi:hypothetical protein JJB74_30695 [Noviherbaspirillum sp. DKR-6]|uniref:Uncharacterized protein n=1 Tax=Noviherbaspirillum pedocola TaxID=2801341 RepID=A0A934WA07_9BURK|nr:hypothetical protein [Noviherbaspirillum pedocola]
MNTASESLRAFPACIVIGNNRAGIPIRETADSASFIPDDLRVKALYELAPHLPMVVQQAFSTRVVSGSLFLRIHHVSRKSREYWSSFQALVSARAEEQTKFRSFVIHHDIAKI